MARIAFEPFIAGTDAGGSFVIPSNPLEHVRDSEIISCKRGSQMYPGHRMLPPRVEKRGFLHRGKLDIGTDKCRSNNTGVLGCVCERAISVCCACNENPQSWVMSSYQETEDILEVSSTDDFCNDFQRRRR